jgi:hypothetical protein
LSRTYCTLFDKNYLVQGVALHRSLLRHAGDFKLYALCMDDTSYALLQKMNSASLIPIHLDQLITNDVLEVRRRTTHGQFCWVCQSLVCEYILDRFEVDMVTYLEADSLFFSDPEVLFAEIGSRSVSVVPHNFSPEFNNSATAGRFCVQFNAFRNDHRARQVLSDWKKWCFMYDRSAPHIYPGQTCLDGWPARFDCVAVIGHKGAGVAPWNIRGYKLHAGDPVPKVDDLPVVFYHYHQYGRLKCGAHELGSYPIAKEVVECFYRPYVRELGFAERSVRNLDPAFTYRREYDGGSFRSVYEHFSPTELFRYLDVLKRKLRGRYNVYPETYFSEPPEQDRISRSSTP